MTNGASCRNLRQANDAPPTLSPILLVFLDLFLDGCLGRAARLVPINRVFARRAL